MTDVVEEAPLRAYVLEDDPELAALEADLLRELGYEVATCTRIVDMGDLLAMALPHLLVVDVMLPDGDGGDVTRLLAEAWPGIPVVFVSAVPRQRLAHLEPLGPIVEKPFELAAFTAAINEAIERPREMRDAS